MLGNPRYDGIPLPWADPSGSDRQSLTLLFRTVVSLAYGRRTRSTCSQIARMSSRESRNRRPTYRLVSTRSAPSRPRCRPACFSA